MNSSCANFNATKPLDYGEDSREPHAGQTRVPATALASTSTENIPSLKVGDGCPHLGHNPLNGPLLRGRVHDTGQRLTTNQGVAVANHQDSLRIGLRGPTAMEDFILREKIAHFDHERIPERVVHARGSAAHGFRVVQDLGEQTRTAPFSSTGKRTPVFVRFSTVVGERGSPDLARDVRGFATKFYFPFDILDATKIVPEEQVAVRPVGELTLNRSPANFFAETEQVAFCAAHVVLGNDFSDDPLLQGRIHSYIDTQISRLGGPDFHEIPINASVAQVHNNQREGFHRQAINRGRVNYEPNSLAGGCPFQAGTAGLSSFPQQVEEQKVRGMPELFGEHYGQATLFWESHRAPEQEHIINAFRFELTRVQVPAIRVRMVAGLINVDLALASAVASGLGIAMPAPLPRATPLPVPQYAPLPSLSLLGRPGETGIRSRWVALLVANGVDGEMVRAIYAALLRDGAVPRLVGQRLGQVSTLDDCPLGVEITFETGPAVLYHAVIVPDGGALAGTLGRDAYAIEFLRQQYRHGKPLLAVGSAVELLECAGVRLPLPDGADDPGVILADAGSVLKGMIQFKAALAGHRIYARETDPLRV